MYLELIEKTLPWPKKSQNCRKICTSVHDLDWNVLERMQKWRNVQLTSNRGSGRGERSNDAVSCVPLMHGSNRNISHSPVDVEVRENVRRVYQEYLHNTIRANSARFLTNGIHLPSTIIRNSNFAEVVSSVLRDILFLRVQGSSWAFENEVSERQSNSRLRKAQSKYSTCKSTSRGSSRAERYGHEVIVPMLDVRCARGIAPAPMFFLTPS